MVICYGGLRHSHTKQPSLCPHSFVQSTRSRPRPPQTSVGPWHPGLQSQVGTYLAPLCLEPGTIKGLHTHVILTMSMRLMSPLWETEHARGLIPPHPRPDTPPGDLLSAHASDRRDPCTACLSHRPLPSPSSCHFSSGVHCRAWAQQRLWGRLPDAATREEIRKHARSPAGLSRKLQSTSCFFANTSPDTICENLARGTRVWSEAPGPLPGRPL